MPTPNVLLDALSSRKFIYVSFLFMLPITVFTAMGMMSIVDWRHDALWAIGFLISGHTLESVAASIAQPRPSSADQNTTAAAVTVNVPAAAPTPAAPVLPLPLQATRPMNAEELQELGVRAPPEPPPPIRPGT
jgi:hypothetical protein